MAANPCVNAPLTWSEGKLGLNYDPDKMGLTPGGLLQPHPYIMGAKAFEDVSSGYWGPVGALTNNSLLQLANGESQILLAGGLGTFLNPDEYHSMFLEIHTDIRISMGQVIESHFDTGVNPVFATSSNSVLLEIKISSSEDWYTLARVTGTQNEFTRSASWYAENRSVKYVSGNHTPFLWDYRVRWVHSSGGYPAEIGVSNFDISMYSFAIDSWAAG